MARYLLLIEWTARDGTRFLQETEEDGISHKDAVTKALESITTVERMESYSHIRKVRAIKLEFVVDMAIRRLSQPLYEVI